MMSDGSVTPQTSSMPLPSAALTHLPGERPLFYPSKSTVYPSSDVLFPRRDSVRCIKLNPGVSGEGSVYIEWGSGDNIVKLIAAVRGPRQQSITRAKLEVEASFTPFASRSVDSSDFERDLAAYVKEAIEGFVELDLYPFSAIYVDIKVVECGGTLTTIISPAITAASRAFREAGISMKEEIVSVAIGVIPSGELLVDPEESFVSMIPCCVVAIGTTTRRIALLHTTGVLKGSEVIEAVVTAADSLVSELSPLVLA